jgi:hypothetical protein
VGFGHFVDWENGIRSNLGGPYAADFVDLDTAGFEDFDAIIPIRIEHYDSLARHPELRGHKFFHPSVAAVAICHDKLRLTRFLVAGGFSNLVPPLRGSGPPYPYVWKRRRGYWGIDCHVVTGPQDEQALDLSDDASFAQALASGEVEFATHILRTGGEIRYVSTFAHEMAGRSVILSEDQRPVRTSFTRGCDHLDLFSEILARLRYEGTVCFDYKVVDGQPLLLEINPRFGGTLSGDITAYLDAYVGALT